MKKPLIRKAREPKARFVGTALLAQLATFVLAFYLILIHPDCAVNASYKLCIVIPAKAGIQ